MAAETEERTKTSRLGMEWTWTTFFEVLAEAWQEQTAANDTIRDTLHGLQATDVALLTKLVRLQWVTAGLGVMVGVLVLDRYWQRLKRRVIDWKWHG